MKSLNEYLIESKQLFEYRVKFAGEMDNEMLENFKRALGQFDMESSTGLKKTPITKDPFGFPGLENTEIHIMDVQLNYPASSEQLVELARLQGFDPNHVRVLDKNYDESMTEELERTTEVSEKAKLEDTDYPAQTPEQKEAGDKYSEGFKDIVQNAARTEFEIAGGKPEKAKFNTDKPNGNDSPMTKTKRPSVVELLK